MAGVESKGKAVTENARLIPQQDAKEVSSCPFFNE